MKKTYNYILLLPCLTFLVWYFVISYANVFSCDDFWHGTNVHNNGFLKAQSWYWNFWEGSYVHTFLATLPHIFSFEKVPFICNLFSYSILLISFMVFNKTYFKFTLINNIIYSLFTSIILLTFSFADSEIRFWVCANVTYIFGISTTLFFLSCYHNYDYRLNLRSLILLLLIILTVGNKISFIYALVLGVIIHDYKFNRLSWKKCGITLFIIFSVSLFNLLAPGNFERLALNMGESAHYSFLQVLYIRLSEIFDFFIVLIALMPLCILTIQSFEKRTLLICSIGYFLIFLGDSLIMYVCFHDPGPKRGNIILEVSTIGYLFVLLNHIFYKIKIKNLKPVMFCMGLVFIEYFEIIPFFQIDQSLEYSNASLERNKIIRLTQQPNLLIDPLPDSGLLNSYFCNEDEWLQFVYLPYFNKDIDIHVVTKNNHM